MLLLPFLLDKRHSLSLENDCIIYMHTTQHRSRRIVLFRERGRPKGDGRRVVMLYVYVDFFLIAPAAHEMLEHATSFY